jgi:hypothetical protein
MKKFVTLTESDLTKIVKRVLNESHTDIYYEALEKVRKNPEESLMRVNKYIPKTKEQYVDKNFYVTFIESVRDGKPLGPSEYIGDRLSLNMDLFELL